LRLGGDLLGGDRHGDLLLGDRRPRLGDLMLTESLGDMDLDGQGLLPPSDTWWGRSPTEIDQLLLWLLKLSNTSVFLLGYQRLSFNCAE